MDLASSSAAVVHRSGSLVHSPRGSPSRPTGVVTGPIPTASLPAAMSSAPRPGVAVVRVALKRMYSSNRSDATVNASVDLGGRVPAGTGRYPLRLGVNAVVISSGWMSEQFNPLLRQFTRLPAEDARHRQRDVASKWFRRESAAVLPSAATVAVRGLAITSLRLLATIALPFSPPAGIEELPEMTFSPSTLQLGDPMKASECAPR